MKDINENLAPFRKSQADVMAGFGKLATAAMAEGTVSMKHKELIALAIGITQHCSGCIAFHVKGRWPRPDERRRSAGRLGRHRRPQSRLMTPLACHGRLADRPRMPPAPGLFYASFSCSSSACSTW